MKKIYCYISSVLCGITLLTCSACSATPTVAKGSNDVPEQSPVVPIDAEKGTTDPAENIQMLIPNTIDYAAGAQTDDGYYYIEPNQNDYLTGQIRYIDYASAVNIPLSAQVNSEHTTEADTSYLDSIIGDYRMFLWGEKIYYIRAGASSYIESSDFGDLAASAVYSMDKDGSNRKLIYQGNSSGDLLMYAVGWDNTLCFMRQTISNYEIFSISTSGGDEHVLSTFPIDVSAQVMGCIGRNIYFLNISTDENVTDEYGSYGLRYTIKALNVDTDEMIDVMDIPQDGTLPVQPFISGEHIYLCHLGSTRKIDAYDANGTLQSSISLSAVMPENVQAYVGRGPNLIGTTYIIPCCDTQTKLCFNILADVNTQEINSSSIQYTQSDGKDTLSAQIIAESPTDYLAITAVNYVDAEMPQGDGTSITVQNSRYTYELIPKDEFCSDSYASRTVQWVD